MMAANDETASDEREADYALAENMCDVRHRATQNLRPQTALKR
jgi:hypothetical protein